MRLTIAARQSHLARHQALEVAEALKAKQPNLEINFHFRESLGDKHLQDPLWKMPERGVFTEDFVEGLLNGEFDMVVHSWKDLPVETRSGLELTACLPRADQRDLLLVKKSSRLKDFTNQPLRFFTSSPRRMHNLKVLLPQLWPTPISDLVFESVRGNIPTRIRKMLEAEGMDGLILAKAALDRLMAPREGQEWFELRAQLKSYVDKCEWMVLPLSENPTAAAQGAIVVETKSGREDLKTLLKEIHCESTFNAVQQERHALKEFGGGCHLALGISMVDVHYHKLLRVKGLTPAGAELSEWRINYDGPQFVSSEVCIVDEASIERKSLSINEKDLSQALGLFVSRLESLPASYVPTEGQILWSAGLQTWKKLAQKGVWVHGTSDSLGYGIPKLEFLGRSFSKQNFLRLTHSDAVRDEGDRATYQVITNGETQVLSEVKIYYWKSGSQAERFFKVYPWLHQKRHACGWGDTRERLLQLLGPNAALLSCFLNVEEFKKTVIR